MSFAAAVQAGPPNPRTLCPIGRLLGELDDAEADALRQMLDPESGWTTRSIIDEARKEGHATSKDSVGPHRTGSCRCVVR